MVGTQVDAGALEGFPDGQTERLNAMPEVLLECVVDVGRFSREHGLRALVAAGLARGGEGGRCHWGGEVDVVVAGARRGRGFTVRAIVVTLVGRVQHADGEAFRVQCGRAVGGMWKIVE